MRTLAVVVVIVVAVVVVANTWCSKHLHMSITPNPGNWTRLLPQLVGTVGVLKQVSSQLENLERYNVRTKSNLVLLLLLKKVTEK